MPQSMMGRTTDTIDAKSLNDCTKSSVAPRTNPFSVKVLKCQYCPKTFKYKSCWRNHEAAHSVEDVKGSHGRISQQKDNHHTCQICGKNYTTSRSVTNHMLSIHSDNGFYTCIVCGDKFSRYNSLTWHLQKHTGHEVLKCTKCMKYFPSVEVLRMHCCSNLGGNPLNCHQCSIQFEDVESYIKSHSCIMVESCYYCSCCHYSTRKQEEFAAHFGRHTGKGFFRCHICSNSFSSKAPLRAHLKQHSTKESITCKLCGKTFRTDEAIIKHGLQVHGPKTLKCPECPKYFARPIHLKQHVITTHTRKRMLTDLSSHCIRNKNKPIDRLDSIEHTFEDHSVQKNTLNEIQNKSFDTKQESNSPEFNVDDWLNLQGFEVVCERYKEKTSENNIKSIDNTSNAVQKPKRQEVMPIFCNYEEDESSDDEI